MHDCFRLHAQVQALYPGGLRSRKRTAERHQRKSWWPVLRKLEADRAGPKVQRCPIFGARAEQNKCEALPELADADPRVLHARPCSNKPGEEVRPQKNFDLG